MPEYRTQYRRLRRTCNTLRYEPKPPARFVLHFLGTRPLTRLSLAGVEAFIIMRLQILLHLPR